MSADAAPVWCHDCDVPVTWPAEFVTHAHRGHAVTFGRCPGRCEFKAGKS